MRETLQQLGISEDPIGQDIFQVFPFLPDKVRQEYKQVFETGQTLTTQEVTQVGQRKRWTQTHKIPILSPAGTPVRVITIVDEITERKQTEEKLQQYAADLQRSNRELEQFATIVSHDLREPLRMVSGHLRLLAQEHSDQLNAQGQESITYAIDGADRMQRMIQDLLAYAQVGAQDRALQPTNCEDILQQALSNLQVSIEESAAAISHDPLPTVMADPVELTQLLQNLVSNAVKFCNQPPRIHIWAEERQDAWRFGVRDNGIGIDPSQSERIFEVFQRLHTLGEYPGTGMGLAICKKIVERHGGRIWVESQPGQGSTFYFTLPRG
jgi:PAS domain S-box-containing protein